MSIHKCESQGGPKGFIFWSCSFVFLKVGTAPAEKRRGAWLSVPTSLLHSHTHNALLQGGREGSIAWLGPKTLLSK